MKRFLQIITLVLALVQLATISSEAAEAVAPPSDTSIRNAVEKKLAADPGVFSQDIDTQVRNGVLTLEGDVENLVMKKRAVELAKTRRGVRAVVNRLKVRPLERPDDDIADAVRHVLRHDPLHEAYSDVMISVEDGVVFLTGTVPSGLHQKLVTSLASEVIGAREIENRTMIAQGSHEDSDIKLSVEGRLLHDVWLADSGIEIDVTDGNVVLSGTVASDTLRDRAAHLAWVPGTVAVFIDNLEVDPSKSASSRENRVRTQPSDTEIAEAIRQAWKFDPRLLGFDLKVHVGNGEATLMGKVSSLSALAAAEEDARNAVGVDRVVNLAKVQPLLPVEDDAIQSLIDLSIRNDPYLNRYQDSLDIAIQNGRVRIRGMIENDFLKYRLSRLLSRVSGVREIRNQLRTETEFAGPPPIPTRPPHGSAETLTDSELQRSIEDELYWSWEVEPGDIKVKVDDGVAILSGKVENFHQREAATAAALEAGSPSVINEVEITDETVKPGEDG